MAQSFGGRKFWQIYLSQPKIFPAKILNVTMYTICYKPVVLDLPNFPPPIACLATNRQKLTLPKFCAIRYSSWMFVHIIHVITGPALLSTKIFSLSDLITLFLT